VRQESKANLHTAKLIRREYREMEKSGDTAKSAQAQLCAMLASAGAKVVDGIGPVGTASAVLSELDLSPVDVTSPLGSKGAHGADIGESTAAGESAQTGAFTDDDEIGSDGSTSSEESAEDSDDSEAEEGLESSDDDEEGSEEEDSEDSDESDEESEDDGESVEEGGKEGDVMASMILSMHRPEAGGRRLGAKWVWCHDGVPEPPLIPGTAPRTGGERPVKKASLMTGEGFGSLCKVAQDAFSAQLAGAPPAAPGGGTRVFLAYRDEDGDVIAVDSNEDVQLMQACFTRKSTNTSAGSSMRIMVSPVPILYSAAGSMAEVQTGAETVHSASGSDGACTIRHWKQGKLLGTGSFGKVFEGLDVDTGRQVAIKTVKLPDHLIAEVMSKAGIIAHDAAGAAGVLPLPTIAAVDDSLSGSTGATSGSSLDELVGEIRLMQTLLHPNIVQYLGSTVILAQRKLLIFMAFASGGSLMSVLQRYRSDPSPGLPADIVMRYTKHVLQGLVYLHGRHIAHRDLKPANVLLDSGVAKLADFGCSKVATQASVETSSAIGTALYCAPELLSDAPSYGTASDIWSLGITVAQLFNGELPWSGNVAHAVYKVCFSTDMPGLPTTAPASAVDFVSACLVREAASRPSAEELLGHPFITV
jgi:hypothetical protein